MIARSFAPPKLTAPAILSLLDQLCSRPSLRCGNYLAIFHAPKEEAFPQTMVCPFLPTRLLRSTHAQKELYYIMDQASG